MAISVNVSIFNRLNVADSCAIWNLLSSDRLYLVARSAGCHFCCTNFVKYECLIKPRTAHKPYDQALREKFKQENANGIIRDHHLEVDDLRHVELLRRRKKLSMGELSSIAFAMRTQQAFFTDDQNARKLASSVLEKGNVQTTPHLFGWLIFSGHLGDSDKDVVVQQHCNLSKGELAVFLQEIYLEALRCRLLVSPSSQTQ